MEKQSGEGEGGQCMRPTLSAHLCALLAVRGTYVFLEGLCLAAGCALYWGHAGHERACPMRVCPPLSSTWWRHDGTSPQGTFEPFPRCVRPSWWALQHIKGAYACAPSLLPWSQACNYSLAIACWDLKWKSRGPSPLVANFYIQLEFLNLICRNVINSRRCFGCCNLYHRNDGR